MNLQAYGVTFAEKVQGLPIKELESRAVLEQVVTRYATYLQTDSMAIAASLFMKRYAVLTAAACVDYFELQQGENNWLEAAHFDIATFILQIDEGKKLSPMSCWKKYLFKEHLENIVDILAADYKINRRILWENIAVRINAALEKNSASYEQAYLEGIAEELSSPIDGLNNPMKDYIHAHKAVRKTCCRYYQLDKKEEGMPYCLVCPLKK
ncbi:IucA/IucC family C-terminal-domain containing protein [Metasolibacillus meyeri]|uniref:IucA/IucC family C-terminal-domain containing protein n=1 Tax=Metasolibacillus meyeri TaxID=1071052 RepID=A0AAW9NLK1_9BACL|nr:IucA/IucC family C-terminal-domain containing protein [Metasolibacillus meyeri]MEC1178502.1 IucA/IucC family C-terminal-domain containing protein [Metasolibacillus meyeri]